jgi:hypothetical protein
LRAGSGESEKGRLSTPELSSFATE